MPTQLSWRWTLLLVAAAVLVTVRVVLRLRAALESSLGRSRAKRGLLAERAAEALLERRGFRVIERQLPLRYTLEVDGQPKGVSLSADLLVERGGRRWVAEVKTGEHATRWSHGGTRRQLLEYQHACGLDAILLVDPVAESVRELRFPSREQSGSRRWRALGWALLAGVLLGFVLGAHWTARSSAVFASWLRAGRTAASEPLKE